jgi:outer membrane lipoprotein-sorting protein
VTAALTAQISGSPYRATTRVDTAGTVTEMIAEVIPPDAMYVTIGGGNMEIILLDGTVWSKTGEAAWMQMGSPEMMAGIFDAIRGQTDGSAMSNVQLIGTEPVFGVSCDVYSFTSTLGEGEGAVSSEVVLWISKESGLPVRMESSSTHAGVTTTAEQSIEYDDTITIAAPTQ